jgi:hypothetical protein
MRHEFSRVREEMSLIGLQGQHHVDVRFEQFRHDFIGTRKDKVFSHDDKIRDHEKRIVKLEHATFSLR